MTRHKEIKVTVRVFDTVYDRAEYWRKKLGAGLADANGDWHSRSAFYAEAIFLHCNRLAQSYPDFKEGEIEAIHNNDRIKRLRKAGNEHSSIKN